MLQVIREKITGIVAWTVVILIALAFGLTGLDSFGLSGNNTIAAKVNGQKISWQVVDDLYQNILREQMANGNIDLASIDTKQIKKQIRDKLVNHFAIIAETKKYGFLVDDSEVLQVIMQVPQFQQDGQFSIELYKKLLQQNGNTQAGFQEELQQTILLNQAKQGLLTSSFIMKDEMKQAIRLVKQKRTIGHTVIPKKKFISSVSASDKQIKEYYENNKDTFQSSEEVKVAYLELTIDDLMSRVEILESALKDYYNQHLGRYTIPEMVNVRHILITASKDSDNDKSGEARTKADDLLAQLKLGKIDFQGLARKSSDDKVSAEKGGNLGWIGKGDVELEFEKAAFALKNKGDVSGIIQTSYGFHIIQLADKQKEEIRSFSDVQTEVEAQYRREKAEDQLTEKAEELASLTFENPSSLQVAAESLNLTIKETEAFSRDGGKGIAKSQTFIDAAFNEDLLVEDRNSDLVRIDDENYVVLRVKKHIPSKQQEQSAVTATIKDILISLETEKQAKALGDKFLAGIRQGKSPYKLAEQHGLEWLVNKNVGRDDIELKQEVLLTAFTIPRTAVDKQNSVFKLSSGDYSVVAVSQIKEGVLEGSEKDAEDQHIKFLSQQVGQLEYSLYENHLATKADIKLLAMP